MDPQRTPGAYVLTIRLPRATDLAHRGRTARFAAGYYVYAGSALGGVEARVRRHLAVTAVRHWHVDALLAAGRVVDAQVRPARARSAECRVADGCRYDAVSLADRLLGR